MFLIAWVWMLAQTITSWVNGLQNWLTNIITNFVTITPPPLTGGGSLQIGAPLQTWLIQLLTVVNVQTAGYVALYPPPGPTPTASAPAVGPLTVAPTTLTYTNPASGSQTITISDPNNTTAFSATTSLGTIVSPVASGASATGSVVVSPLNPGSDSILISDGVRSTSVPATVGNYTPGPITLAPTSASFTNSSSPAQTFTISESNYSGSFSATTANASVATASTSSNVLTVTPVGTGTTSITVHNTSTQTGTLPVSVAATLPGPLTSSPTSLTFTSQSAANQTIAVSDPNYTGSITASASPTGLITWSYAGSGASQSVIVTPVSAGTTTLTISDGINTPITVPITINKPGPMVVSPTSLTFSNSGSAAQTVGVTDTNFIGTVVVTSSPTGIVSTSVSGTNASETVTVTPVSAGNTTISISDGINTPTTVPVSVGTVVTLPTATYYAHAPGTGYPIQQTLPIAAYSTFAITAECPVDTTGNSAIGASGYFGFEVGTCDSSANSGTATSIHFYDSLNATQGAPTNNIPPMTAYRLIGTKNSTNAVMYVCTLPDTGSTCVEYDSPTCTNNPCTPWTAGNITAYLGGAGTNGAQRVMTGYLWDETVYGSALSLAQANLDAQTTSSTIPYAALSLANPTMTIAVGGSNQTNAISYSGTGTITIQSNTNTGVATATTTNSVLTVHAVAVGSTTITITDGVLTASTTVTVSMTGINGYDWDVNQGDSLGYTEQEYTHPIALPTAPAMITPINQTKAAKNITIGPGSTTNSMYYNWVVAHNYGDFRGWDRNTTNISGATGVYGENPYGAKTSDPIWAIYATDSGGCTKAGTTDRSDCGSTGWTYNAALTNGSCGYSNDCGYSNGVTNARIPYGAITENYGGGCDCHLFVTQPYGWTPTFASGSAGYSKTWPDVSAGGSLPFYYQIEMENVFTSDWRTCTSSTTSCGIFNGAAHPTVTNAFASGMNITTTAQGFYSASANNYGWPATQVCTAASVSTSYCTPPATSGFSGAGTHGGISFAAQMISDADVQSGHINHEIGLGMGCLAASASGVWPGQAISSDTDCSQAGWGSYGGTSSIGYTYNGLGWLNRTMSQVCNTGSNPWTVNFGSCASGSDANGGSVKIGSVTYTWPSFANPAALMLAEELINYGARFVDTAGGYGPAYAPRVNGGSGLWDTVLSNAPFNITASSSDKYIVEFALPYQYMAAYFGEIASCVKGGTGTCN